VETERGYPAGQIRVSDADRDAALAELSEHFQAGRLTAAELDERAGRAIRARTGQDLAGLMADLPASQRPAGQRGGAGQPAGTEGGWWRPAVRRTPVAAVVVLAAVVAMATLVASRGHDHRLIAPWWLLLAGFLILRRLAPRRRYRADQYQPGSRSRITGRE